MAEVLGSLPEGAEVLKSSPAAGRGSIVRHSRGSGSGGRCELAGGRRTLFGAAVAEGISPAVAQRWLDIA